MKLNSSNSAGGVRRNSKAFTLAEVLITLAIIGIIAAITIPSIVANHQKRALETQFAKAYRTLSQVVNLAVAEHGGIETWDWHENKTYTKEEMDALVKKYFLPHLNVVRFCPADNSVEGCAINQRYDSLIGKGTDANYATVGYPRVLLADGSFICFVFPGSARAHQLAFDVDVNGHKKPNTVGRDTFSFVFFKETGEFLPNGVIDTSVLFNKETQSYTYYTKEERDAECGGGGSGWHCGAKIILDGFKMNY